MNTYTIRQNPQYNSLEITFNGKPAEAVRDFLKSLKFRWHNVKKCWYGYANEHEITEGLNNITTEDAEPETIQTGGVVGDGYLGGGSWTGCNTGKLRGYAEINKVIKKEMQRRFPGVIFKTRGKSYAGGQSSHFYIGLTTNQLFKRQDEFINDYIMNNGKDWHYLPDGSSVHNREVTPEQRQSAATLYHEQQTGKYICTAPNPNSYRGDNYLTSYALDILRKATTLYASFIHDESNSMVDYFDRNLYDSYSFINLDNAYKREAWEA